MDTVLHDIAATDARTLSHAASSKWLDDIHIEIRDIKTRIHDLVTRESDVFVRQHIQAKSISTRLGTLTTDIDSLAHAVNDPHSGLVVTLTTALSSNKSNQQQALDASILAAATQYLHQCTRDFHVLNDHFRAGRLPAANIACVRLLQALDAAPEPLPSAKATRDLRTRVNTLQHNVREQLSAVLSRCIAVSKGHDFSLTIHETASSGSERLSLQDVTTAVQRESLNSHLNLLRKELSPLFETLIQPTISAQVAAVGDGHRLSLNATPSDKPFASLTTVLQFLHKHLFPHLPTNVATELASSLSAPMTSSLIQRYLVPRVPTELHALPDYLALAKEAVSFEQNAASSFGIRLGGSTDIADWVSRLPAYYERSRRDALLQEARSQVLGPDETTLVDVPRRASDQTESGLGYDLAVDSTPAAAPTPETGSSGSTWDFEDAQDAPGPGRTSTDSWGFEDDEDEAEGEVAPAPTAPEITVSKSKAESSNAWGWDDDDDADAEDDTESQTEDASVDTAATTAADDDDEDDPWEAAWGDDAAPSKAPPASAPPQTSSFDTAPKPRTATRLEKKLAKARGAAAPPHNATDGHQTISSLHNGSGVASQPTSVQASPLPPPSPAIRTHRRPPEREKFLVSRNALAVLDIAQRAIAESRELAESAVFADFPASVSGKQIMVAASAALDLYRTLVPVSDPAGSGTLSTARGFRFSNECAYLGHAVEELVKLLDLDDAALLDTATRMKALGSVWFEDTLDRRKNVLLELLGAADGFADIGSPDTFDQTRTVIEQLYKDLTRHARDWSSGTLSPSARIAALGTLVDAVLEAIVAQVLELDDIPEQESHHLGQLCAVLTPLEDLFIEQDGESSQVVQHVPTWLKFSYLSELLEASLADISYLFDEGALIDFETDELVKLIRALFADTPNRANALAKISEGHVQR